MGVMKRLAHAFNAFTGQSWDPSVAGGYGQNPFHRRYSGSNERSIVAAIYTRLAIDCSGVDIRHVMLDEQKRYKEDVDSGLNQCLNVEANIDQDGRALLQDIYDTMFDRGHVAIVPVDMTINPKNVGNWDILTMRVGEILEWYPRHVKVRLYNDQTGRHEDLTLEKGKECAVIHNPLYKVMNEPNSTLARLIKKLNILDVIDAQAGSGKLDLIIQLPYQVKTETMRNRAEQRRSDLEFQMANSKFGIAYTDATEKIIQLNRPAENNLLAQIQMLFEMVYTELGLTKGVMDGTADEAAMLNYINRTIEPCVGAVAGGMLRSFISKNSRTRGHSIMYFRDPFKLVPMKDLAEMADKFTRNEIVTSNEFRGFMGLKPADDPKADQLRNSNMPESELGITAPAELEDPNIVDAEIVEDEDPAIAALDSVISRLEESL